MMSGGGVYHHARGERQEPALFQRTLHPQKGIYREFHHLFFLSAGSAILRSGDHGERLIKSPSLVSLPYHHQCVICIAAGGRGILIGASPQLVADGIGDRAESYSLRMMIEQIKLMNNIRQPFVDEVAPLIVGFALELADPLRASWMVVSAYLRLILMGVWRLDGLRTGDQAGRGQPGPILQRYRQLVESWFLQHRPIGDYSGELGVTSDRLHAICQRELGRSPIQLLHERVIQEAKLRLERSDHSIQEIAGMLGFREATYFSQFFSKKTSYSPQKYRQMARKHTGVESNLLSSGYADWP